MPSADVPGLQSMSAGKNNRKRSGRFSRGFVQMPRKAGRRRKKRGGASFYLLLFLVLLVAGFLARRLMQPAEPHYVAPLGHRAPAAGIASGAAPDGIAETRGSEPPGVAPGAASNPQANNAATSGESNGENLTPADHRALDDLIREKSR